MSIASDFHPLTIAAVKRETPDAISVTFAIPEALRASFAFKPGQHLNVRATLDGEELRRSYSICSDPDAPGLRIAIKQVAGGRFSGWANRSLRPGMALESMPPTGRFVLAPGDGTPRHILGIAAGAGITPIIGMVRSVLLREPEGRATLVYGNRGIDGIIFREELEDLKDRFLDRFTLMHVFSGRDAEETPLLAGRITGEKVKALSRLFFPAAGVTHAYLCGPGSLIKEARNALFDLGLPRERVHHEFFAAGGGAYRAAPSQSTQPATPDAAEAAGPEIVAVLDGVRHRFRARPGEAVIDAALRAGLKVPFACKGGMCCTCRAKLVEGTAPMRVNYSLEPWEIDRGFVLTCQAVPSSERLVVDYDQL